MRRSALLLSASAPVDLFGRYELPGPLVSGKPLDRSWAVAQVKSAGAGLRLGRKAVLERFFRSRRICPGRGRSDRFLAPLRDALGIQSGGTCPHQRSGLRDRCWEGDVTECHRERHGGVT